MLNKIIMEQTKVDRRSFIKKMAAAAAMTAAATMFPGIVFAAEQIENIPKGVLLLESLEAYL